MALKIDKVELDIFGKKRVILAKDVVEMGIPAAGLFAVDRGDGVVEMYSCDFVLTQHDDGGIVMGDKKIILDGDAS